MTTKNQYRIRELAMKDVLTDAEKQELRQPVGAPPLTPKQEAQAVSLVKKILAKREKPAEVTGRKLKVGDVVRCALTTPGPGAPSPRPLADMDGVVIHFRADGGSGGVKTGSARVRWSSGSVVLHDGHMLVKVGETLTWSRKRVDGDVVWTSGPYEVVVTGTTAAEKPVGWGAKLNGEWLMTKGSVKYNRPPTQVYFDSVAAAKGYCCRHFLGVL